MGAFLLYETVLAVMAWTAPFVGLYHVMGMLVGIGMGMALRLFDRATTV